MKDIEPTKEKNILIKTVYKKSVKIRVLHGIGKIVDLGSFRFKNKTVVG